MSYGKREVGMKTLLLIGILLLGTIVYSDGQNQNAEPKSGRSYIYTAKKFGIPIFKAILSIENGSFEERKLFKKVYANVDSLNYLGILFRMSNRFSSTIEGESGFPIQYIKEIDQEGLLTKKKNYIQTVTFDHTHQKAIVKKKGENQTQEILLPPSTYDPLSMFARYYWRDEVHPGEDIKISIFDGNKLREIVFHSKKENVDSKLYGKVEAVCLESSTPFSSFGDKEGIIRIWFLNQKEKIPILIEIDLPIGDVKFELEEVKES